jgi:hypothetical protein
VLKKHEKNIKENNPNFGINRATNIRRRVAEGNLLFTIQKRQFFLCDFFNFLTRVYQVCDRKGKVRGN